MSNKNLIRILIVGNGAREYAVGKSLLKNKNIILFFANGNGSTSFLGKNLPVNSENINSLVKVAKKEKIDFVFFGSEKVLAKGGVDIFLKNNIAAFGPTKGQARLEASKIYAQNLMEKLDVPCPQSFSVKNLKEALNFLDNPHFPYVIKADGLADGKGVFLPVTKKEAVKIVKDLMVHKKLGKAGDKILFQEKLQGKEESIIVFVSNKIIIPFPLARDFKRLSNNDKGPNTGGMGAVIDKNSYPSKNDIKTFVQPVVNYFSDIKKPLRCIVYAQKITTKKGTFCLEYNMRPGDPEMQTQLQLLKSDLFTILKKTTEGKLNSRDVIFANSAVVNVVLASSGYPKKPHVGNTIYGIDKVSKNVEVLHAGTRFEKEKFSTNGGRVLNIVAKGVSIKEARERVMGSIGKKGIYFSGMQYRTDIR